MSVQFPTSSATVVGSVGFINPTQVGYSTTVSNEAPEPGTLLLLGLTLAGLATTRRR